IKLFKMGIPGYPTYMEWIRDTLKEGETVGFDGKLFPQSDVLEMQKKLENKKIKIVEEYDLISSIWTDRPELPMDEIFIHDVKYAGKTPKEKLEDVRKEMEKLEVEYYILGSLDDI